MHIISMTNATQTAFDQQLARIDADLARVKAAREAADKERLGHLDLANAKPLSPVVYSTRPWSES